MNEFWSIGCELLVAVVSIPIVVLFIEVVLAMGIRGAPNSVVRPGRVAVLMPAHDEEGGISIAIQSILSQLSQLDRLIVIADNCSDRTADVARELGAEVITRQDAFLRGKGYALDFGVQYLESNAPDIVIVIDADCIASPGCIERLASACNKTARPIQALYLMKTPQIADVRSRIAEFAWLVKNQVRPLGLLTLNLPCQLMGSGMALPWQCVRSAVIGSGHIVEDLKLGIDLAYEGWPPLFCPEAVVTSEFPQSAEGRGNQRTRWEHGHLGVILGHAPRLLLQSILSQNANLCVLALDLCVPPLALLALLAGVTWVLSAAAYLLFRAELPLCLATIALLMLTISILLSWSRYGRETISLLDLLLVPWYLLAKIPIYIRFLVARQVQWVRSTRGRR